MFETVEHVIPGEYDVVAIPSATRASEALQTMLEHRYSQIPVVDGDRLVGVFSLWSLATHLHNSPEVAIGTLEVGDLVQSLPTVTVEDSLHSVLDLLYTHEALLVNSPQGLQAVTTAWDFLDYFYKIARPYVLLREVELALRELIRRCAPAHQLGAAIEAALAKKYEMLEKPLPSLLDEMTFDEVRAIIDNKTNWPLFEGILGRNRLLVSSKLKMLREIRNDVFHFRSEHLSIMQYKALAGAREWLLRAVSQLPEQEENP